LKLIKEPRRLFKVYFLIYPNFNSKFLIFPLDRLFCFCDYEEMENQILTLPGVEDLLKRTWQVYKTRLGTFLGIMVFPVIVNIVFLIAGSALITLGPILFFTIFLLIAIAIIIALWAQVSLLYAVKEREIKIGIVESFRRGWPKIISFFWISLLTGFITVGGFLLLIVPGIIFAVWFAISRVVLVSEDFRGMNALLRSKQLVAGYWGKVFWRLIVIGIIVIVIYLGIAFPVIFSVGKLVGNIIGSIIPLFLTPFLVTYSFLIFEDLRKLKIDLPFEPPKRGTKIKFILIGIIGFLLILGILVAISLVF